jgi:peptidoglycan/xylan/chitin deacetylase (PgdA/CDA1 family)
LSESLAWLRHLKKRRGRQVFSQAVRMYKLHRLPFEKLVGNILEATQKNDAGYTFPIVASVAAQKPELLKTMTDGGAEVAAHGYRHLKYPLLSAESQEKDVKKAVETFAKLGVPVTGFRAPYNAYDENTPRILEDAGFLWDGGIGYSPSNRDRTEMFRVAVDGRDSKFTCLPVNYLSDDLMVDDYGYTAEQMTTALNGALDKARKSHAIVAFDLHPIRIGQPEYVSVIDRIISYGKSMGGWFPTTTEAVKFRQDHGDWGGYEFCCLLTGDIDNFYFRDYLKRLG